MTIDSKAVLPAEEEARAATAPPSIDIMSSPVQGSTTEADEMDAATVIVAAFKNLLEAEQHRPRVATKLVTFALQFATAVLRPVETTTVNQYLAKTCQWDDTGRRVVDMSDSDADRLRLVILKLLEVSSSRSGASVSTSYLPAKAHEFCDAVMNRIELGRLVYAHWRRAHPYESRQEGNDDDGTIAMSNVWTWMFKECVTRNSWCRGPPYCDDWDTIQAFADGCCPGAEGAAAVATATARAAASSVAAPENGTMTMTTTTMGAAATDRRRQVQEEGLIWQGADGNVGATRTNKRVKPTPTPPPAESSPVLPPWREFPRLASIPSLLPNSRDVGAEKKRRTLAHATDKATAIPGKSLGSRTDVTPTSAVGNGSESSPFEWLQNEEDDRRSLAHPGQPLVGPPVAAEGFEGEDDDDTRLQKLQALYWSQYHRIASTFLSVPAPAPGPFSSSIRLTPIPMGTALTTPDQPVATTVWTPTTTGPPPDGVSSEHQKKLPSFYDRNQEGGNEDPPHRPSDAGKEEGRAVEVAARDVEIASHHLPECPGISPVRQAVNETVLPVVATALGGGGTSGTGTSTRIDLAQLWQGNHAFVASHFDDPHSGGGSTTCRVCEARISNPREDIGVLMRHAMTTACLIRRVERKLGFVVDDAAHESLVRSLRVRDAIQDFWMLKFQSETPAASAYPSVAGVGALPPLRMPAWRCRRCNVLSRQGIGPFASRHLPVCLGIVPVIHGLEEVLLPVVASAMRVHPEPAAGAAKDDQDFVTT